MTIDALLLSTCILKICGAPRRHCSCTLGAKCLALFLGSQRHHLVQKEVVKIKYRTRNHQTMDRVQMGKELTLKAGRVGRAARRW